MTPGPTIPSTSALLILDCESGSAHLHRGPFSAPEMCQLVRGPIGFFQFMEVVTVNGKIDDSEPSRDITGELIEWLMETPADEFEQIVAEVPANHALAEAEQTLAFLDEAIERLRSYLED